MLHFSLLLHCRTQCQLCIDVAVYVFVCVYVGLYATVYVDVTVVCGINHISAPTTVGGGGRDR